MESEGSDYDTGHITPAKIQKIETRTCIICSNDVPANKLTKPRDISSWHALLDVAILRQFGPILRYAEITEEIPKTIEYETKCRNDFVHKKSLAKLHAATNVYATSSDPTPERRSTQRQPGGSSSIIYPVECIFCSKYSKYVKQCRTRENLMKCEDMRADTTVRDAAMRMITTTRSEKQMKLDERILALTSREIVAAEAYYHKSCYIDYTRIRSDCTATGDVDEDELSTEYAASESTAYNRLFDYVRADIIGKPHVAKMTYLTDTLVTYLYDLGVTEIKPHTKKHIRRNLEKEFSSHIHIFSNEKGRLLIMPDSLSKEQLANDYITIKDKLDMCSGNEDEIKQVLSKAALNLRSDIKETLHEQPWPPNPTELDDKYVETPPRLSEFLTILLTGETDVSNSTDRTRKLVWSFAQDIIHGTTMGRTNTSKHILLPWAVKTLTGNVEIIKILNRLGHGISYSKLEEIDTALCLQKLQTFNEDNRVVIPSSMFAAIPTVLAFDNIDRQEETLSGAGTSHRVNGIIVQPQVSTVQPPPNRANMQKDKRRSVAHNPQVTPQYDSSDRQSPPAITPLPPTTVEETEATCAKQKNMIWSLARQCDTDNQTVCSWTGFNILTNDQKSVTKDTVGYLPTINAPATQMSTVHHILEQTHDIMKVLHLPEVVCVFDQALYAKAAEIVWKNQEYFNNIVLRMGAFHTVCNLLSIIGKRFSDAGLRDLAVEANVIAEGSIDSILDGRQYNRGVRLHKILYEGLLRLTWKRFYPWLEEHHDYVLPKLREMHVLVEEVSRHPDQETLGSLMENESCGQIMNLFDEYSCMLRNGSGPLAAFWMSYVHIIEILLALIRASREGNWPLHIHAIRQMIPWCFAYDKQNYARYLSVYHAQMTRLPEQHPSTYEQLLDGGFSVQISSSNTFGRIPVDQTVEETINRDTQTSGGTKGFSLKASTVSKYYMTAEYRSQCLRQLRSLINVQEQGVSHPDLGASRIRRDEADVQSVVELLENNWIDPFDSSCDELLSISSGIAAPTDVATDLLNAQEKGEAAYTEFVDSRLQTGSSFYERLPKLNLKSFRSLHAKKKAKNSNKETLLKADHRLFGRMLLIASSRKMNMEEVLQHPLGPLPLSLANCDGTPKKTNKAALARHLEKQVSSEECVILPSTTVIDGMACVHKLHGDNYTFEELSDQVLTYALRSGSASERIDIVFDVYRESSIKQIERLYRGAAVGITFSKIVAAHKIKNWRRLLASSASKEKLIEFFAEDWQSKGAKIGGKVLYLTHGQKCHKISNETVEEVDELNTTHEEADTRLLLHANHAAQAGFKSVTIVAEDTDVMILSIAFAHKISCALYMRCGTKTRTRLISINKIAMTLGHDVCDSLMGMHAFTGCDTTSAFSGQGKLKGLKLLRQCSEFQHAFASLGQEWSLSGDTFELIQEFTCKLYATRTPICRVNELRYQLWRAKKGTVESGQLPPCKDSLYQHTLRANYQTAVWRRSLEAVPDIPVPQNNHGWTTDDGRLAIQWMSGSPAPQVILEFISCKCSRTCKLPSCQCLTNGLKCTDECKLQDCANMGNTGGADAIEDVLEDEDNADEIFD